MEIIQEEIMAGAKAQEKMNIGFISLGCAKNLVDSEIMLGLLAKEQYRITPGVSTCDVAIVNSCGFIEASRKESVDQILELVELKNKGHIKHIIVSGCLAQKHAGELHAEIPEIDALVGTGEFHKIDQIIKHLNSQTYTEAVSYPTFLYDHAMPRLALTPHYSRYVKIAEGCNHTCSFCIIPQMRGAYRSRPIESIVTEVKKLADEGLREVNLISQETTYYGRDIDRTYHLPELLSRLNEIDQIHWIRLFYNHPQHMHASIIEAIATLDKVLPYIDMPLQHINDRILKSMRRGVSKVSTKALIQHIRAQIPDAILRTTFMVGYPGETDAEFDELCQFVEETAFHHVGVFMYSQELDSASGCLPNQIPARVKKSRFKDLMKIQQAISLRHNQAMLNQYQETLIEGKAEDKNWHIGRLACHAPDVDGKILVHSKASDLKAGTFVPVRITDALPYDLIGEAEGSS